MPVGIVYLIHRYTVPSSRKAANEVITAISKMEETLKILWCYNNIASGLQAEEGESSKTKV